jgi:hypothetical protein
MSSRLHDVVRAASKALHDDALVKADRDALRWARALLKEASSREVLLAMPSAQELTGVGSVIVVLRRAARPDDGEEPEAALAQLQKAITGALRGARDDVVLSGLEALRSLFSRVSRRTLQNEVLRESERDPGQVWDISGTISLS